jgi:uncharacterized protein YaiE (UPF0345 family)
MANTLLNISMITLMAEEVLENQLKFTKHVKREFDDYYAKSGAKIGDTLNVRLPVRYAPTTGPALQVQDSTESSVALVLDTQYQQSMAFSSKDMTLSVDEFQDRFVKPAVAQLANQIDLNGMALYKDVYQAVGTPGTTPSTNLTYLNAGVKLDNSAAPYGDNERAAVINPVAQAVLVNANSTLFNPSRIISDQYENGAMGSALGWKFEMDQNVRTHTFGVLDAATNAAVNTTSVTGATTISLKGVTSGDTFKQGDIFTVANVYSVNPQSRESTGQLQQFVVTADAAATGTTVTLNISPQIVYNPTNQAFQSVDSLPAANAAVTFFGASGTVSPQNLAFHRDAFAFASADLILPGGVDMAARKRSPKLNISIRLVRAYDISNDRLPARLDVIGGWKTIRAQLAARVAG